VHHLIVKFIISIIDIPVISMGIVSLRALLQSVVRRLMTTGVTPLARALFSKMPDAKTVVTLTVLHIGWIGRSLCIGQRRLHGDRSPPIRGRPVICQCGGILESGHDPCPIVGAVSCLLTSWC
jgi:hypothetical protein